MGVVGEREITRQMQVVLLNSNNNCIFFLSGGGGDLFSFALGPTGSWVARKWWCLPAGQLQGEHLLIHWVLGVLRSTVEIVGICLHCFSYLNIAELLFAVISLFYLSHLWVKKGFGNYLSKMFDLGMSRSYLYLKWQNKLKIND